MEVGRMVVLTFPNSNFTKEIDLPYTLDLLPPVIWADPRERHAGIFDHQDDPKVYLFREKMSRQEAQLLGIPCHG